MNKPCSVSLHCIKKQTNEENATNAHSHQQKAETQEQVTAFGPRIWATITTCTSVLSLKKGKRV